MIVTLRQLRVAIGHFQQSVEQQIHFLCYIMSYTFSSCVQFKRTIVFIESFHKNTQRATLAAYSICFSDNFSFSLLQDFCQLNNYWLTLSCLTIRNTIHKKIMVHNGIGENCKHLSNYYGEDNLFQTLAHYSWQEEINPSLLHSNWSSSTSH